MIRTLPVLAGTNWRRGRLHIAPGAALAVSELAPPLQGQLPVSPPQAALPVLIPDLPDEPSLANCAVSTDEVVDHRFGLRRHATDPPSRHSIGEDIMTTVAPSGVRPSAAEWDQWTTDHLPPRVSPAEIELFRQAVSPHPGMTAVDLACGTGEWTRQLFSYGITVTGYDYSDEALRQAETAGPHEGLSYAHWDIVADPIPGHLVPGGFDLVTCRYSLPYLEPGRLLTDVGRWLKPEGVFYALVHLSPDVHCTDTFKCQAHDNSAVASVEFHHRLTEAHLSNLGTGWARRDVYPLGPRFRTLVLSGYGNLPPQPMVSMGTEITSGLAPAGGLHRKDPSYGPLPDTLA